MVVPDSHWNCDLVVLPFGFSSLIFAECRIQKELLHLTLRSSDCWEISVHLIQKDIGRGEFSLVVSRVRVLSVFCHSAFCWGLDSFLYFAITVFCWDLDPLFVLFVGYFDLD